MKKLIFAMISMSVWFGADAMAYTPFTVVNNVCPKCTQPKADVATMSDGAKVAGQIIGENNVFYVMLRFGELRILPKNEVQVVEFANGAKPSNLSSHDQILLKSGHVISGTITEDKDLPALFQVKASHGDMTFVVFKSEVSKVYRAGLESSF
jgi:hypothetical protein